MNKQTIVVFLLAVAAAGGAVYFFVGNKEAPQQTSIVDNTPVPFEQPALTVSPEKATVPSSDSRITVTEVARHSQASDCWMMIGNKVYDFTSYIPMHPGGQRAIIDECGGDGTRVFMGERKHSRPDVQSQLAAYLIGTL